MADLEGIERVGFAVWFDGSDHRWDTLPVLGIVGDDSYLFEIDGTNRERLLLDIVDNYDVEARGLRIEVAFFGKDGGFFASPMNFLELWPKSAADLPADVFIDERYRAAFSRVGDEIVVSVRHALRPSDGPTRRRLRFRPNEYEETIAHLAEESERLRDDLITAAQERAPQKVRALMAAFRRPPV
jgi:hypothetical protein